MCFMEDGSHVSTGYGPSAAPLYHTPVAKTRPTGGGSMRRITWGDMGGLLLALLTFGVITTVLVQDYLQR